MATIRQQRTQQFPKPPIETPYLDREGKVTRPWVTFHQAVSAAVQTASNNPPAASTDPGMPGQLQYDEDFLYIKAPSGKWKRVSLGSF